MEDGESAYCMYTVLNMNWTPTQFAKLSNREKAFVIASIKIKMEAEREERRKIKNG